MGCAVGWRIKSVTMEKKWRRDTCNFHFRSVSCRFGFPLWTSWTLCAGVLHLSTRWILISFMTSFPMSKTYPKSMTSRLRALSSIQQSLSERRRAGSSRGCFGVHSEQNRELSKTKTTTFVQNWSYNQTTGRVQGLVQGFFFFFTFPANCWFGRLHESGPRHSTFRTRDSWKSDWSPCSNPGNGTRFVIR